jgi:hypothetical protein
MQVPMSRRATGDRCARPAVGGGGRGDGGAARRQRCVLQDRLSARLAGGLAVCKDADPSGKQVFLDLKLHDIGNTVNKGVESIANSGRDLPHRACLSADHEGRGRRRARIEAAHPRRHGAHLLRRCRPCRSGLRLHRAASWSPSAPRRRATSASTASSARRRRGGRCA